MSTLFNDWNNKIVIIDAHAHIGSFKRFGLKRSQDIILKSMEKYHIDYSLISNGDASEFDNKGDVDINSQDQITANQATIDFVKKHPENLGALLWCRPFFETADAKLDSFIATNRQYIHGLKFHPFGSKVAADEKKMEPYYKLARKYHLPILFHTAIDDKSKIIHLKNVALKYPDLTFIAAHMELITDNELAIKIVSEVPNIYGDTAWVKPESTLKTISKAGIDKIMFGTDNPVDGPDTLNNPIYQTYLGNSFKRKLGAANYHKFMGINAATIYKVHL